jgi:hypothetical protein
MYVRPLVHPSFTYFFTQSRVIQMTLNFHILAKITEEPPALRTRKYSHPQRPTLRTVSNRIDREFARVYLGSPEFRGAAAPTVAYHALLRTRAETSGVSTPSLPNELFIRTLYPSVPI